MAVAIVCKGGLLCEVPFFYGAGLTWNSPTQRAPPPSPPPDLIESIALRRLEVGVSQLLRGQVVGVLADAT